MSAGESVSSRKSILKSKYSIRWVTSSRILGFAPYIIDCRPERIEVFECDQEWYRHIEEYISKLLRLLTSRSGNFAPKDIVLRSVERRQVWPVYHQKVSRLESSTINGIEY